MQIGVVFPQTEIGADPAAIRGYAQAMEGLGLSHIAAFDHVLGVDPTRRPGFKTLYTHEHQFHEPFTLFAYLAGVTTRIGFVTSILVLPQRQTALVAKQAAEVDVLSGGRLRLGVGVGWNAPEYEGLGADFHDRGQRSAEQIEVLRRLWTEPVVSFEGRWHKLVDVGINPLPVQRPISIWLGGMADAVIERVGRVADGWFPRFPSMRQRAEAGILPRQSANPAEIVGRMQAIARAAGRDPASIGIEGRVFLPGRTPEQWREELEEWRDLGATHMQLYTMEKGLSGADQHIEIVRRFVSESAGW
jgi:probable F420-dependent oxidoreductase